MLCFDYFASFIVMSFSYFERNICRMKSSGKGEKKEAASFLLFPLQRFKREGRKQVSLCVPFFFKDAQLM